jgi:nucleoside-diphosphate-sugar epimerase
MMMLKRKIGPLVFTVFLTLSGLCSLYSEEKCLSSNGTCLNKPLKIVVIGASDGTTGGLITAKALKGGHHVTAIARTPSKITQEHANLTIVQGNVKGSDALVEPMKSADVVIGAYGHRAFSDTFKATTLYSDGTMAVLGAMKQAGVKKLIMLSSSGTSHVPGAPFVWDHILRVSVLFLLLSSPVARYTDRLDISPMHYSFTRIS